MEHVAQMAPLLIVAGLVMGWLAEAATRAGGYGLINDMLTAVAGSIIAGSVFWMAVSATAGMVAMLLIGCTGGGLAIAAQRAFWRSARSRA